MKVPAEKSEIHRKLLCQIKRQRSNSEATDGASHQVLQVLRKQPRHKITGEPQAHTGSAYYAVTAIKKKKNGDVLM